MADDEFRRRALEWDETERRFNIEKHGIDFLDAPEVMNDPGQYTYRSKHPEYEARYVTVGKIKGVIVAIIFTPRGQNLRIISARRARKHERERYEQI
ncbi:BrnT family toxin [Afipia birgiae]|uniref:BrnT family toxin n=1 Tax=Afipia birgiae TaxID=151414 RepID=UPI00031B08BA|nr:BrnT family toxin [Afipia birgiae]MBX9820492.1 BrnT family toxin [Afipia birgiae]